MSLIEGENDKIIKDALELLKENESTDFLTKEQQEDEKINKIEDEGSNYGNILNEKRKQKIFYNIERKNNKQAEISLLANAEKNLRSKLDLITAQTNDINKKNWQFWNKNNRLVQIETLDKDKRKIDNDLLKIEKELKYYDSHKSGGKRKTKKNKSRRRKTKKTKN